MADEDEELLTDERHLSEYFSPHVFEQWREGNEVTESQCQAIRTSSETLLKGLLRRLPREKDAQLFIELYERIHALFEIRILRGAEEVRELFGAHATFSVEDNLGEGDDGAAAAVSDEVAEEMALQAKKLVDYVHGLVMQCNFEVLSQEVFDFAEQAEFECTIDQKMDPSALDSSFFEHLRTGDRSKLDFAHAADLCKHVLVYHRGIGSASVSGYFIIEKIDLLLEWAGQLLVSVVCWPWTLLHRVALSQNVSVSVTSPPQSPTDDQDGTPSKDTNTAPHSGRAAWIQDLKKSRVSLSQVLWTNPVRFFTSVTLSEPTFKEVLLVYRTEEEYTKALGEHRRPQVQIALFRDIPIADFETILPKQRALTRAFDIFKLLIVFVGVVLYIVRTVDEQLDQEDRSLDDVIDDLIPAVIGLAGYALKMFLSWRKMQATYQATIMKFLQTYTLAKQQAVLPLLINEMLQQELKESILAYFFLWKSPNDTPALLDDECEHYLHSFHGETVDFDVKDALFKLKQLEIVKYKEPLTDTTQLSYMPIVRAVRSLTDAIFKHMRSRERTCPYCRAGICRSNHPTGGT
eukprot:m.47356 g.47356  ORF g.47356 m.47356 type:complete len:576 (+) comp6879_c0_seq1:64-1791(+)